MFKVDRHPDDSLTGSLESPGLDFFKKTCAQKIDFLLKYLGLNSDICIIFSEKLKFIFYSEKKLESNQISNLYNVNIAFKPNF